MTSILLTFILISLDLPDGTTVECETERLVIYQPDVRVIDIDCTDPDVLFTDGFES